MKQARERTNKTWLEGSFIISGGGLQSSDWAAMLLRPLRLWNESVFGAEWQKQYTILVYLLCFDVQIFMYAQIGT